jgi:glutamate dehydrogenase/leucine dehydrogenase
VTSLTAAGLGRGRRSGNNQARVILYAPDYVLNLSGVIFLLEVEIQGWTQERADKEVVESIRYALWQVSELAATEGITTDAAARQMAAEMPI